MLNVTMLTAKCCVSFMINIIMLSAIMLRVIMLFVVAPYGFANCFQTFHFLHLGNTNSLPRLHSYDKEH